MWWRTSNCSSLLIYRPRDDERLSWPGWLTYSRQFTHISGHPSATGRAQDRESLLARDRRSTIEPRSQPICVTWLIMSHGMWQWYLLYAGWWSIASQMLCYWQYYKSVSVVLVFVVFVDRKMTWYGSWLDWGEVKRHWKRCVIGFCVVSHNNRMSSGMSLHFLSSNCRNVRSSLL